MGLLRKWGLLPKKKRKRSPFYSKLSYSQLHQDIWVLRETGHKRGGFFVEIGAFDGTCLSNSYLLEESYGWTGILAEPNPAFSEKIRSSRTSPLCTCPVDALTGTNVEMLFVSAEPELSSMRRVAFNDKHADKRRDSVAVTQQTISMNDMLAQYDAPEFIDYISIDTEGSEPDILSTFDFNKYRVSLFSVEHNNTGAEQVIDAIMSKNGYDRVHRQWSRFDAWYRLKA